MGIVTHKKIGNRIKAKQCWDSLYIGIEDSGFNVFPTFGASTVNLSDLFGITRKLVLPYARTSQKRSVMLDGLGGTEIRAYVVCFALGFRVKNLL